jgi:cell division inhibitor SepF
MSPMVKRVLSYLGLVDDYDDEDEEEFYSEQQPARVAGSTLPDLDEPTGAHANLAANVTSLAAERARVVGISQQRSSLVKTVPRAVQPQVHVVMPTKFADAQQIGDLVKGVSPVIVNLEDSDRDLSRRMIDFCSGVTYALGGSMEKVADQVFLLTPSNVEVSPEHREQLQARGFARS